MPDSSSARLLQAQRELALTLASAASIHEMLRACADVAMELSGAECGAAYQLMSPTGALGLVHQRGLGDSFLDGARSFAQDSPVLAAITQSVPYVTGLPPDLDRRARCLAEGLRVVAVYRVEHQGCQFGTIHLASRQRDRFSDSELSAVEVVVAQAARAAFLLDAQASSERRSRYADAIAACAACLVQTTEPSAAFQGVLDALLRVTGVNRAYVVQNVEDEALGLCMDPVAESIVEGMEPQMGNPAFQRIPYAVGAPSLLAPLSGGELFKSLVRKLDHPERDILEAQGVQSVVFVPIQVQRRFWGFIGLIDCFAERVWPDDDIRALRTVASMLGSFLAHQHAALAVRESEARYRAIVEGFDGLICICSSDHRVQFANARAQERWGGPAVGQRCYRVLHGRDDRCPWCADLRVSRGEIVRFEVQSPLDDRWYYCVNTPIHHADGSISTQSLILDITEQKRTEEAKRAFEANLAESQRLESLGVLAGGIAHDFNNLLVAILGNAELASLHIGPSSAARAQLDNIRAAAQRAADLTSQMLACAGKGRFVVQRLSLNDLVTEIAGLLQLSVPRQAQLICELAPGLPAVDGDGTQLGQVVMNLLKNACDALVDGRGSIAIRTGLVEHPSGEPGGPRVFLQVSDTGVGMDDKTRARIFEPFFTTKFTGRGLGLAAVQGIIRSHGGTVEVRSAPGEGTTFRVTLPVASRHQSDTDSPPA